MSVYEDVKKALQDLLAPGLERIEGEMKALRAELQGVKNELKSDILRLEGKLDLDRRMERLEKLQAERVERELAEEEKRRAS